MVLGRGKEQGGWMGGGGENLVNNLYPTEKEPVTSRQPQQVYRNFNYKNISPGYL